MKISQALLGAMLVGLAAPTTSCTKKGDPTPKQEEGKQKKGESTKTPDSCPACGMG
ncbi:chryseobasin-related MNIO class RiPP peptide [Hymenobacter actinosclerus]|uniref:Uncharacterized protein n=1 Tax=Hymenobacter actinosclerus TaxID=82805 RepID=A0A1I0BG81_9BACT|nr:hypothetical protein [Hymenobacter actinosclerus]SET05589.1 hypothetical protein SAMN04487998_1053 [Hymenobacter actinosclerus]